MYIEHLFGYLCPVQVYTRYPFSDVTDKFIRKAVGQRTELIDRNLGISVPAK